MCGSSKLVYNVSSNGANGDLGGHHSRARHLARGLAPTSADARAEAVRAGATCFVPTPGELAAVAWQIA